MVKVYIDATKERYGIIAFTEKEDGAKEYLCIGSKTCEESDIILSTLQAFRFALEYLGAPIRFYRENKATIYTDLTCLLGLPLRYFMKSEKYVGVVTEIFKLLSAGHSINLSSIDSSDYDEFSDLAHKLATGEVSPSELIDRIK